MTANLRIKFLERLRPLLNYMGAPEDLKCFFLGIEVLKDVLNLLASHADDAMLMQITKNLDLIAYAQKYENKIVGLFPLSDRAKGAKFHSYMEAYPHCCIYFSNPKQSDHYQQWLALVATALPYLVKLDQLRISNPSKHMDDNLQFCRAFRQLSHETNEKNSEILNFLPRKPTPIIEYIEKLDAVCKILGYELENNNVFRQFYYIRLMLSRDPEKKVKTNRTYTVRRPGGKYFKTPDAVQQRDKSDTNVAYNNFVDETIDSFKLSQYFEPKKSELKFIESFDDYLKSERVYASSNLTASPERMDHYFLENRHPHARKRARYAAQAMEMSNQNLPFSRSKLSGYEVDCFLKTLKTIRTDNTVETFKTRKERPGFWRWDVVAFCGCIFYLSQSPETLLSMRANGKGALPGCISLQYDGPRVFIPITSPDHAAPPRSASTVGVVDHLELLIPLDLLFFLPHFDSKALLEAPKGILLFDAQCVGHFIDLLNHINKYYHTDLTPRKIQMALADEMTLRAPADRVVSLYFRGEAPNSYIPAIYSVIPHTKIQKLYENSVAALQCSDELKHGFNQNIQDSFIKDFETKFVGSLHVPTNIYVKDMLSALRLKFLNLRSSKSRSFVEMHNTYTAWVALFYLATCGVRSVSNIMPSHFDIDFDTGTAFVSDKDNEAYFHARLVWLCKELVDQLKKYQEHLKIFRHVLSIDGAAALDKLKATDAAVKLSTAYSADRTADELALKEGAPFFFFIDERTNAMCATTPTWLGSYVSDDWALRLVSLRHFIRSSLIEAGCSGEVINALMGHHMRGESPWGPYSTLPPVVWREKVSAALTPVIKRLGLEALDGPFTWRPLQ